MEKTSGCTLHWLYNGQSNHKPKQYFFGRKEIFLHIKQKISLESNAKRWYAGYNWLQYNGQSKAKRSIRRQRQWLDSPAQKSSLFSSFLSFDHPVVVFKHFQWQNLSYLVGVHNPLKSFSKTTQIQLIRLIQMCRILI